MNPTLELVLNILLTLGAWGCFTIIVNFIWDRWGYGCWYWLFNKKRTVIHEAGHALIASRFEGFVLNYATVKPKRRPNLSTFWYTQWFMGCVSVNVEDTTDVIKLYRLMLFHLGGMAAENVVLGNSKNNGCGIDLEKARKIANSIAYYSLDPKLHNRPIEEIIKIGLADAQEMICANRARLDRLVIALNTNHTLEGKTLTEILA